MTLDSIKTPLRIREIFLVDIRESVVVALKQVDHLPLFRFSSGMTDPTAVRVDSGKPSLMRNR